MAAKRLEAAADRKPDQDDDRPDRGALGAALVFIAGFAFLTFVAVAEQGFSLASLLSVFILVLLAVGIVAALRNPPAD